MCHLNSVSTTTRFITGRAPGRLMLLENLSGIPSGLEGRNTKDLHCIKKCHHIGSILIFHWLVLVVLLLVILFPAISTTVPRLFGYAN